MVKKQFIATHLRNQLKGKIDKSLFNQLDIAVQSRDVIYLSEDAEQHGRLIEACSKLELTNFKITNGNLTYHD